MVAKIATGEVEDNATPADKMHHSAGGKKGGAARAAKALAGAEISYRACGGGAALGALGLSYFSPFRAPQLLGLPFGHSY